MASEFNPSIQYRALSREAANSEFPEDAFPRIIFIPTINGAFPASLEPRQNSKYNFIDFPDTPSANAQYQALHKTHSQSSILAHDPIAEMPSETEVYDNNLLGDRRIEPLVFIFRVNGKPISKPVILIAEFDSAEKAFNYTMNIWNTHRCFIETLTPHASRPNNSRPIASSSSSAHAPAPVPAAAAPAFYSSSSAHAPAPVPAAAAPIASSTANTTPNAPPHAVAVHAVPSTPAPQSAIAAPRALNAFLSGPYNGYKIDVLSKDEDGRVVVECWFNGHPAPEPLPGGRDVELYGDDDEKYTRRVTFLPDITESVIEDFGGGLVNVEQSWPVNVDAPALPKGHTETYSEVRVGNRMVRKSTCFRGPAS